MSEFDIKILEAKQEVQSTVAQEFDKFRGDLSLNSAGGEASEAKPKSQEYVTKEEMTSLLNASFSNLLDNLQNKMRADSIQSMIGSLIALEEQQLALMEQISQKDDYSANQPHTHSELATTVPSLAQRQPEEMPQRTPLLEEPRDEHSSASELQLTKALDDDNGNVRVHAASELLSRMEQSDGHIVGHVKEIQIVLVLVQALRDEDWIVRKRASEKLCEVVDPYDVSVVKTAVRARDEKNRIDAIQKLRKIDGFIAVPALIEVTNDVHEEVRREGILMLVAIRAPIALPVLKEKALDDKNENVRHSAVIALADFGDASSVPTLIEALGDEKTLVRQGAAFALGQIGDSSAEAALREAAMTDVDERVRLNAREALDKIGML